MADPTYHVITGDFELRSVTHVPEAKKCRVRFRVGDVPYQCNVSARVLQSYTAFQAFVLDHCGAMIRDDRIEGDVHPQNAKDEWASMVDRAIQFAKKVQDEIEANREGAF